MSGNNKTNTTKEISVNDTYLVVKKGTLDCIKNSESLQCRFAYRNNLFDILSEIIPEREFSSYSPNGIYDSIKFREMVNVADKNGYSIYQLTRL